MSDEPVPETLETIAAKITALTKSMEDGFGTTDERLGSMENRLGGIDERLGGIDERLGGIDERLAKGDKQFTTIDERLGGIDERLAKGEKRFTTIDEQFAETRAQLGVKIEAVDAKVSLVYDVLIAMREESEQNARDHKRFTKRLNNHDVRILALEKPGPSKL
jgi:chromosome segregation ATPase